jgi:hypothetical protein
MSGSGKSTTAQWLSLTLRDRIPTIWYHEDGPHGDVRRAYSPTRFGAVEEYVGSLLSSWESFLQQIEADQQMWIVESAVLQIPVIGLLLNDVPVDTIRALVRRIMTLVLSARPVLVFLCPSDSARALRRACKSRYEELLEQYVARNDASNFARRRGICGFSALVRFWEEFSEICDGMYEEFASPKARIDTSLDDWPSHREQIAAFLRTQHLPIDAGAPVGLELDERDLQRFAGTYSRKVEGATSFVQLRVVDGALTVFGLSPFLWHAGNRLIPIAKNVFAAVSWPTDVHFEERDGRIETFRLRTVFGGRATDEVFPRASAPG